MAEAEKEAGPANIEALRIRIGFRGIFYHSLRNPQNPILMIKAPTGFVRRVSA